jgi:hypothetical protein
MERRNFIGLSIAGFGLGIVAPTLALATSEKQVKGSQRIVPIKKQQTNMECLYD